MKFIFLAGLTLLINATLSQKHNHQRTPCGKHQYLDGHFCRCEQDLIMFRGRCVKCPPQSIYDKYDKTCRCQRGMLYDRDSNACRPICQINEIVTINGCQCRDGYNYIQGVCTKCPDNSWFDQNTQLCFCLEGYQQMRGKCIKNSQANEDEVSLNKDSNSREYFDGDCYQQIQTSQQLKQDDHSDQTKLPDQQGSPKQKNTLQYQNTGLKLEEENKAKIQEQENINQQSSNNQSSIEQPQNNQPQVKIVCGQGFRIYRNKCIEDVCPPNQIFMPGQGCKCEPGYQRINATNCGRCPDGSIWKNNQCLCDNGMPIINNQCQKTRQNIGINKSSEQESQTTDFNIQVNNINSQNQTKSTNSTTSQSRIPNQNAPHFSTVKFMRATTKESELKNTTGQETKLLIE